MKSTFIALCALFSINTLAADFTIDCDKMRSNLAALSSNLQNVNKDATAMAAQVIQKGGNPDTKSLNTGIAGIADTIDGLTYLVDQSCK